jgi:uncharacterized repeat protein (TIGR04076 family)
MTKLKITVVKTFTNEEVFGDKFPEDVEKANNRCRKYHPGQTFTLDEVACPEGFCAWAFADIFREIRHLMLGGDYPWTGKPGVAFASCTDGKKPVIFKLERVEE